MLQRLQLLLSNLNRKKLYEILPGANYFTINTILTMSNKPPKAVSTKLFTMANVKEG